MMPAWTVLLFFCEKSFKSGKLVAAEIRFWDIVDRLVFKMGKRDEADAKFATSTFCCSFANQYLL
jgi:hypothetical protein